MVRLYHALKATIIAERRPGCIPRSRGFNYGTVISPHAAYHMTFTRRLLVALLPTVFALAVPALHAAGTAETKFAIAARWAVGGAVAGPSAAELSLLRASLRFPGSGMSFCGTARRFR